MTWTLSLAARATLVLVAAAIGAWGLGRASAATRHAVWGLALAALLVLPVLSAVLPPLRVPLLPAGAASEFRAPEIGGDPGVSVVRGDSAARAPIAAGWGFVALWLAGAGVVLTRLASASFLVSREARRAQALRTPEWERLLGEAATALGVRRRVELRRSPAVDVPSVSGWLAPIVLVPAAAESWSEARRRAILLHELAHVARHDRLVQTLAYVVRALYWPHPLVWWATSRVRREAEHACDDRVLAAGTPAAEYALHLVGVARGLLRPAGRLATASSGAASTHLRDRVAAVLDDGRSRRLPTRRVMALGGAASLIALAIIAAAEPAVARPGGQSGAASSPDDPRERIVHEPVGCVVEQRFADVEARIEPAAGVSEARLYFANAESDERVLYWSEMVRRGDRFVGRLPRPRLAASPVRYRIEARMADGRVTSTKPYLAVVAPSELLCPAGARVAPVSSSTEPVVVHSSKRADPHSAG